MQAFVNSYTEAKVYAITHVKPMQFVVHQLRQTTIKFFRFGYDTSSSIHDAL
jgi:hypothetical protein